jgi:Ti-type conjugative transfer relaxase TraA
MLTIKKISGSEAAAAYYAEYAQGKGEGQGYWVDHSGELVAKESPVTPEAMLNMLRGMSPSGDTPLCQNPGEGHQPGWDLTFSPPKSVSIAWSNASPELRRRIEDAHKASVASALQFLNEEATKVRTGRGGKTTEDGRLVAALFQHSSNRAEEPQLHTHAIVFNVAQSAKDGKWRTLNPLPIYRAYMAAGALYKADLAYQMRHLGFEIERTKDSFELSQIPTSVCEAQSSRSRAIEEALSQQGLTRAEASPVMKELMALSSREAKGSERIVRDFGRWQRENAAYGFGPREQKWLLMETSSKAPPYSFGGKDHDQVVGEGLSKITLQASTFNTYELYRSMAEASICETDAKSAMRLARTALQSPEVIPLGPGKHDELRFSTKEMVAIEGANLLMVAERRGENRHPVSEGVVHQVLASRPTMKQEQVDALRHVVCGSDGITFIEGDAGTGKSFMMAGVREAYEKSGYEVRGISFTNKAAQNLEEGSGIKNCQSVDSLLRELRRRQTVLQRKTVLVLDEAGMLDSRKISEVLKFCKESGAKLVCVGDQKQIQPIAAGQAFGAMKRAFGSSRLCEIMRQKEEWLQIAIRDFAEGRAREGIDALERHGALKFTQTRREAREEIINEWSESVKKTGLGKAPLMVVTTNHEVDSLNHLAREELVRIGLLEKGKVLSTAHGQKAFSINDKIVFTSNLKKKGIYNSSIATVENIKTNIKTNKSIILMVKTENGRRIRFDLEKFSSFRHAYAITAHKSQGSTVDQVMVLVDGRMMDREKFYVAVSRGRENPRVFADEQTLGEMSFEDRKNLASLPQAEKGREEREFLKASLARMLGISHEKDTSQDFPATSQALDRLLGQKQSQTTEIQNRWKELKARVAEQLQQIHSRVARVFKEEPSMSFEGGRATAELDTGSERAFRSGRAKERSYEI